MPAGIFAKGSVIREPLTSTGSVNARTMFNVEFARTSRTRGCAPTLVPVEAGGGRVDACIIIVATREADGIDGIDVVEQRRDGEKLVPRS